jgi:hypothetical protein
MTRQFLLFVLSILPGLLLLTTLSKHIVEHNNAYAAAGPLPVSNKTTTRATTTSTSSSSPNCANNICSCQDYTNGFSISFPSNWTKSSVGSCTLFTPTLGKIPGEIPASSQAYLRISSADNLSMPISSIDQLARNVIFFTNHGFFQLLAPPNYITLNVGNAVELDYAWNRSTQMFQPPQVTLPFVNPFSPLPTLPVITPYASSTGNQSSAHPNTPSSTHTMPSPSLLAGNLKPSSTSANTSKTPPTSANTSKTPPTSANTSKTPPTSANTSKTPPTSANTAQLTAAIYIMKNNTSTANTSKTSLSTNTSKTSLSTNTSKTSLSTNTKVYVIEYTASNDKFNRYLPEVRDMIDSFAFLSRPVR